MTGPLLMLIDDDEDDIEFFEHALREGFPHIRFLPFNQASQALEYLSEGKEQPSWIFLDLNMPKVNGVQFLIERAALAIPPIPVIIYTTSYMQRDREQTLELGATHFLVKPSRVSELKAAIGEIIQNVS